MTPTTNITLNPNNGHLAEDGLTIAKLNNSERLILEALCNAQGHPLTKQQLLDVGWPGKIVVANSLNVAIRNIRTALDKVGLVMCLETVPTIGFRLDPNVILITNDVPFVSVNVSSASASDNDASSSELAAQPVEECPSPNDTVATPSRFELVKKVPLMALYAALLFCALVIFYVSSIKPSMHTYKRGNTTLVGSFSLPDNTVHALSKETEGHVVYFRDTSDEDGIIRLVPIEH
ncbi:winged helix-turn-helix domain-containing protein [Vibrio mediterranei]|uniref:OmpR/PhoB-type domain-containing protein n=1 Tax=Vibrio mediterranei TaxID=689 RepID=A0ABX5DGG9_9VIBR|nr:helix-turn-helix domain-containing protein [Vibrio mediterranei]PCD87762.1 hypothetical protein COR52_15340 [Vibrio mediterranei]PRQ67386.1 hypothetical protein COR51_12525 [Vibrio mediterranei]